MSSGLAGCIDHTLLKASARLADVERLCAEAAEFGFCSVCVNLSYIPLAQRLLRDTQVRLCTVVAFPLGASLPSAKAAEAHAAVEAGADEVDMVLNVGAALDEQWDLVARDIAAVRHATPRRTLKVILETCFLSEAQIVRAVELAVREGADFVKTSTGFGPAGATVEHVRLMHEVAAGRAEVKASGGIRDRATAEAMLAAGATRLGCSASVEIVRGAPVVGGEY